MIRMTSLEYTQVDFLLQDANFKSVHNCKLCPYISKSIFFKSNHAKRHRLSSTPFNCFESFPEFYHCVDCDFKTDFNKLLSKHILQCHHQNKEREELLVSSYICRNCDFETYSRLHWLKHSKVDCVDAEEVQNGDEKEEIQILCGSDLKKVKVSCNFQTIKWYKCRYCDYKSKRNCNINQHVIYKHTESDAIKWYQCYCCNHKFKMKKILKRHILCKHTDSNAIKWSKCEHCSYKCKHKELLKRHVKYRHTNAEDIQWFGCEHCNYKTKRKELVTKHVICKHTNPEDIEWLKCKQCSYKGKVKSGLYKHIKRNHPHNETKQRKKVNSIAKYKANIYQRIF